LEDYVLLSRRLVTPIYPADANLIVNLLDLHPDASDEGSNEPKLEILEAGTGHGALTLHLSRAIHAANANVRGLHEEGNEDAKSRRRAIIHTIDVSPKFSAHAETVVAGFRRGMYLRNVDFYVGDVSEWVKQAQEARGVKTFLSHAFLDLPSADAHVETVSEALETNGTLIAFNPSITQIIDCATQIKNQEIPLDLDRVVELGVNGGTGGREWVSSRMKMIGTSSC
jgi:tRNA A58 N-methylase Trm61